METLSYIILVLALTGTSLVAGILFIFSNTIMKALSQQPHMEAIRTMQSINRVILNPVFFSSFIGTTILSVIISISAILGWGAFASYWFLTAACLYLFGTFLYTAARNIPLNEKLDNVSDEEAAKFWQLYLSKWTRYNHHRTVASIIATLCYAIGLLQL